MRIDVITANEPFIQELEQQKEFDIRLITDLEQAKGEAIVISDQFLHYNELHALAHMGEKNKFYISSETLDSHLLKQIKTICESLNIKLLSQHLTVKQQVEIIKESVFPNLEQGPSNVVAFFSPISNVGLTSTILSVANTIGKLTDAKIAVLGLNAWDDGVDQFVHYQGKYLNEIKTQLTNRLLDHDSLLRLFHYEASAPFYYLAGNQNTKMERLFTVEEIDYLVSLAKETFDLVLIDAGSHWDNASMLQSLYHADLKMVVINQQRKALKKFEQVQQHVLYPLGYFRSDFLLIMNDYVNDPGLPTEKDILTEINIPFLTSIPHLPLVGLYSEVNQKFLVNYDFKDYKQSVNHISRGIIGRTKVKVRDFLQSPKQKKKWNLLTRIGGV